MAIEYSTSGYGAYVTKLAEAAGSAIATRQAAEIAAELQTRRESLEAQKVAQKMEQQFQVQKIQLGYQMELEKEARAQSWEIEKMELASRLDFEKSEKKRIKEEQEFELKEQSLKDAMKSGTLDRFTGERELRALAYEKIGAYVLARSVLTPKTVEQVMAEKVEKERAGPGVPSAVAGIPTVKYSGVMATGPNPGDIGLLNNQTQQIEDIDPMKSYNVTWPNMATGTYTGQKLLELDDSTGKPLIMSADSVNDIVAPKAPGASPLPKVQQELMKSFGGFTGESFGTGIDLTGTKPEPEYIRPAQWKIDQAYRGYLDKVQDKKTAIPYGQFIQMIDEQGFPVAEKVLKSGKTTFDEYETEKRKRDKIIEEETNRQYSEYRSKQPKYVIGQGRLTEFKLDIKKVNEVLKKAGFVGM
jgi:hypothetical protein